MVVRGKSEHSHKIQLLKTLEQLYAFALKLNIKNCDFGKKSVNFYGHIIDDEGMRPQTDKIWELKSAPQPADVKQLRSLLGSLNYYGKFIR